jgi:serine/threonine-protein kinase
MPRAEAAARQALALDDSLAEAHASLAWSLFIYDFDHVAAEKEFKRAIQLDPQYAPAHQWYSFLLTSRGRFQEALVEGHTAQENDPASISVRRSLGYCYLYARKYDQARYHLDRAIAMNPTAEESFRILGLILALQGEYAEAERVLREGLALAGAGTTFTKVTLAYALACGGDKSFASQVRDELIEKRKHDYVSPAELAILHIALDDHAAAIDWCEIAVDERRGWTAYLAVHPMLDSVREEPRFVKLLGRLGQSGIRPA